MDFREFDEFSESYEEAAYSFLVALKKRVQLEN
jgi:hypothetical protein